MQPTKQIWVVKGSEKKKKLVVPSKVEDESSPKSRSTKVIPLPYWGDGLPQEMEMLRHVSPHDKRGVSLNPYRYNLKDMSPRPPLSPSPLKPKGECSDGIKEKISELEKVSQACASTVGEGVDAYWMMSKDLGKQVSHISDRFDSLLRTVYEIADENKKILEVMKK